MTRVPCSTSVLAGTLWPVAWPEPRLSNWRPACAALAALPLIGTDGAVRVFAAYSSQSLIVGLDPLYQLLSGGLLLGAIFMATDYTTSPVTKWGKVIFAVGCGFFSILLRAYSNMPEGVSFSILLMNILVPLIERATVPRTLGFVKKKKGAEK